MGVVYSDNVGHLQPLVPAAANLTPSAVGVVTAGTFAGTTAAGAAPTVALVSGVLCNDAGGTFELTPVTGGGAQAAGVVATVRFTNAYGRIPTAIIVNIHNTTTTPDLPIACSSTAKSVTGFDILVAAALTTAQVYRVEYIIIP